jgi:hypothetical protein
MAAAAKRPMLDDPWGELGRGFSYLLVLLLPFHGLLHSVPVTETVTFSVLKLLALVVVLAALARILQRGNPFGRQWWLVGTLFLLSGLSALLARGRGSEMAASLADLWALLLLAAAAAVHFHDRKVERIGVLTALGVVGGGIALLGIAQAAGLEPARDLVGALGGREAAWGLLPRAGGPFATADAFGWLMAILLPIAGAGALALDPGRQRDLTVLLFAIIWGGLLAVLSLAAPLAGLLGLLLVLSSRRALARPFPSLALTLGLLTLAALAIPGVRARWTAFGTPVDLRVRALLPLEGASADSLQLTLYNPGPLAWDPGYETGYHVLYAAGRGDSQRMEHGGWVGRQLEQSVPPHRHVQVTLPFRVGRASGFLTPDIRGPGGFLGASRDLPTVLLFEAGRERGASRLHTLVTLKERGFGAEASRAVVVGTAGRPRIAAALMDGMALARVRPLLGLGPGAPGQLLGHSTRSLLLEALVSYGWLGLSLLFFLGGALMALLKTRGSLETAALAGALLATLIYGLAAHPILDPGAATLASVLVGLAWAAGAGGREEEELRSERPGGSRKRP